MQEATNRTQSLENEIPIGTPTLHSDMANYREGYVCGHSSSKWGDRIEVVYPDDSSLTTMPPAVARNHVAKAMREPVTASQVAQMKAEASVAEEKRRTERAAQAEQRRIDSAAFKEELERRIPAGYKGVVVAELIENDSDSMTDYYGHKTLRQVVLGFTKSDRQLFGNMRKAAAKFEPTAHLAEKVKEDEHRETYSMGGGTYLKRGGRHNCGWSVRIFSVGYAGYGISPAEFADCCPG